MERHITSSKEWFPHLYVPWSRGRDFEADEEWDPEEFPLPAAVRDALFVNLLTEDNLPYYFHTIDNMFGPGVWGELMPQRSHTGVPRLGCANEKRPLDLTRFQRPSAQGRLFT